MRNESQTKAERRRILVQQMTGPGIIDLRGQDLRDYIEELKSRGIIQNIRDLRGDAIRAYRFDLEERRKKLQIKESLEALETLERRAIKVEPIDEGAFANLMKGIIGPRKLGE